MSRTRARLARETLVDLAPRLRRRATLLVRGVPTVLREALERDAVLVRTGLSAARAHGWDELVQPGADPTWTLDAYLPLREFSALQEELNRRDIHEETADARGEEPVLLRVVDEPWPFPPHYQLAAQPLAALDLLDYPDTTARRIGRGVLESLKETPAPLLARRTARARAKSGPLLGRLLDDNVRASPRVVIVSLDQDPLAAPGTAQAEASAELVAAQSEGQMVRLVAQESDSPLVPHDDRASATNLAVVNSFEFATGQAVVADLHS